MEPRLLWDGYKTKEILLQYVHMMAKRHPAWSFLPEISVDFAISHDFCRGFFVFSGMQQIYIMLKTKAAQSIHAGSRLQAGVGGFVLPALQS